MNLLSTDREMQILGAGVLAVLLIASTVGFLLHLRVKSEKGRELIDNLNARIKAWWVMTIIFFLALATGGIGSMILFCLISFLALREYVTLTPTHRADHRALFWAFFVITPLQYLLIAFPRYGFAVIMIPFHPSLFIPIPHFIPSDYTTFPAPNPKL